MLQDWTTIPDIDIEDNSFGAGALLLSDGVKVWLGEAPVDGLVTDKGWVQVDVFITRRNLFPLSHEIIFQL